MQYLQYNQFLIRSPVTSNFQIESFELQTIRDQQYKPKPFFFHVHFKNTVLQLPRHHNDSKMNNWNLNIYQSRNKFNTFKM